MNYLGFDVGVVVLSAYDDSGFLGIQPDVYGEGASGVHPYEVQSPHGFLGRPLDPDTDGEGSPTLGCTILYALEGGRGHVWLGSDPRVIPKLPILEKGETLVYASNGHFIRLDKDGAISIFTTEDGTPNGRSVYLQVAPDGLRFFAPWGTLKFDATGFHVVDASGARLDLGGIAGVPVVGSYASLKAGIVSTSGSIIASGGAGATQPLAYATPLVEILTLLLVLIGKIGPAPANPVEIANIASLIQSIIAKATSA